MKRLAVTLMLIASALAARQAPAEKLVVVSPYAAQFPYAFDGARFVLTQQLFAPLLPPNTAVRCIPIALGEEGGIATAHTETAIGTSDTATTGATASAGAATFKRQAAYCR